MRQLVLISLCTLLLITGCSNIAPDAKATEARIYANVLATITAAAPAATPTAQPLAAFAWAYPAVEPTPAETPTSVLPPSAGLTPSSTVTATPTPRPTGIQISGFDQDQEKLVRGSLDYLKSCRPAMYDYVLTRVNTIGLGEDRSGTLYYFNYGEPSVYLPSKSDVFDIYHYPETSRRLVTAVIFVHAAKRLELGDDNGLSEASKFALSVFDACKPKEASADPNANWLNEAFHDWLDEMATPGCAQGCTYHKPGCDIKGEIYVDWNDKVYFLPSSKSYGAVNMDDVYSHRWFCTENEATAAGWKKSTQ